MELYDDSDEMDTSPAAAGRSSPPDATVTRITIVALDITVALVAIILTSGVVTLALIGKPIPAELRDALAGTVAYLFGKTAGALTR